MPALPATPSPVIRARLIHSIETNPSIGFKYDMAYSGSAPSTGTLATLAAAVAALWTTWLAPMLSTDGELAEVIMLDLANPSVPEGTNAPVSAGTRTGAPASTGIAAVMNASIDRRYRGSRPKAFTPYGVVADVFDAHQWTTAFQTAMLAAWLGFTGGIDGTSDAGTNLLHGVGVSYYHGFTVVTSPTTGRARNVPTQRTPPLVAAVTSWEVNPTLGSQRRRLPV